MEANRDEAMRCMDIAHEALSAGDAEKALRFAVRSQRLHENTRASEWIARLTARSRSEPPAAQQPTSGAPQPTPARTPDPAQDRREVERVLKAENDYYGILAVERGADVAEIKKQYKKVRSAASPSHLLVPHFVLTLTPMTCPSLPSECTRTRITAPERRTPSKVRARVAANLRSLC
jgi:DnaJ homolog subfamily B member 12